MCAERLRVAKILVSGHVKFLIFCESPWTSLLLLGIILRWYLKILWNSTILPVDPTKATLLQLCCVDFIVNFLLVRKRCAKKQTFLQSCYRYCVENVLLLLLSPSSLSFFHFRHALGINCAFTPWKCGPKVPSGNVVPIRLISMIIFYDRILIIHFIRQKKSKIQPGNENEKKACLKGEEVNAERL